MKSLNALFLHSKKRINGTVPTVLNHFDMKFRATLSTYLLVLLLTTNGKRAHKGLQDFSASPWQGCARAPARDMSWA